MSQKDFGNIHLDNSLYSVKYQNAFNGPEQNQIKGVQKVIKLNISKMQTFVIDPANQYTKI